MIGCEKRNSCFTKDVSMIQFDWTKEAIQLATSADLMGPADSKSGDWELNRAADMMIGQRLTIAEDVKVNPITVALNSTTCSVGDSNSYRRSNSLRNFSMSGTKDCGYTVLVSRVGKAVSSVSLKLAELTAKDKTIDTAIINHGMCCYC